MAALKRGGDFVFKAPWHLRKYVGRFRFKAAEGVVSKLEESITLPFRIRSSYSLELECFHTVSFWRGPHYTRTPNRNLNHKP